MLNTKHIYIHRKWKDVAKYVPTLRSPKRFYAQAIIIKYLLKTINPKLNWDKQIYDLLQKYNGTYEGIMGFSENWYENSFWLGW